MSIRLARAYLQEREGREVPYDELATANLAPSPQVLDSDLSRLAADPRNGVTIVGDRRQAGIRRGYRYDKPEAPDPPDYTTLRLVGQSASGNSLAQDEDTREIYEIVPAGQLDWVAGPES
jgi:hypothetical protein